MWCLSSSFVKVGSLSDIYLAAFGWLFTNFCCHRQPYECQSQALHWNTSIGIPLQLCNPGFCLFTRFWEEKLDRFFHPRAISSLPFISNFCQGYGKKGFRFGKVSWLLGTSENIILYRVRISQVRKIAVYHFLFVSGFF